MAASLLSSLPTSGTYNINLSPSIHDLATPSASKKRPRDTDELIALRYAFKPGSVTSDIPGMLVSSNDKGRQLAYDTPGGGQQVFDVREESSKSRECVLIWDEESQSFTLHALPTTLHLTLNRTLSSTNKRTVRAGSPSSNSTTSSRSIPLHSSAAENTAKRSKPTSSSAAAPPPDPTPQPPRPVRSGKSLPTKRPPPLPPTKKTKAPTKSKKSLPTPTTKPKKAGKKIPPPIQVGKYKSAEIIEDSDEEAGMEGEEHEEEDEFARLVGESLADVDADGGGGEEEEESEEDEEDEDEARELGGARLVVREGAETARRGEPSDSSDEESD